MSTFERVFCFQESFEDAHRRFSGAFRHFADPLLIDGGLLSTPESMAVDGCADKDAVPNAEPAALQVKGFFGCVMFVVLLVRQLCVYVTRFCFAGAERVEFLGYASIDAARPLTFIAPANYSVERKVVQIPRPLRCGTFLFPTVGQLRQAARNALCRQAREFLASEGTVGGEMALLGLSLDHVVADSRDLHRKHPNGLFQAASQFNGLEFPSPNGVPEDGIAAYEHDRTQGPACAVACFAGTAYRNYGVRIAGAPAHGQSAEWQLNGLCEMEAIHGGPLPWVVRNGYVDATDENALREWNPDSQTLTQMNDHLRVCLQLDTEVTDVTSQRDSTSVGETVCPMQEELTRSRTYTFDAVTATIAVPVEPAAVNRRHTVSQAYCSALSIGYSRVRDPAAWEVLGPLVLQAAYEATLYAAVLHAERLWLSGRVERGGPVATFLTKLGGGVFANPSRWIVGAMNYAMERLVAVANEAARDALAAAPTRSPFRGFAPVLGKKVSAKGVGVVALDLRVTHFGRVEFEYARDVKLPQSAYARDVKLPHTASSHPELCDMFSTV